MPQNSIRRVGLFVTCLVDLMRPAVGFAALKLLQQAGCEVHVPDTQTCCGQPGYNAGDSKAAQQLARKLLQEFGDCDAVVVPSGSCAGMIRVHYPSLFEGEPEHAAMLALADKTWELTQYLVDVLGIAELPQTLDQTVTYHDCCAGLRELDIQRAPRALLGMAGVELREMVEATTCCGFGGSFSVKFGDLSARMADQKCQHAMATGAEVLTAGDLGCLLHLQGRASRCGFPIRIVHVAELLVAPKPES